MHLVKILSSIIKHPLNKRYKLNAIWRFIKWQIGIRFLPYPVLYPFVENIHILAWKGLTSATGNIYCGLYEYEDMLFLLHFLREEDLFFDVGANIGTYSLLASGIVGARSVCFEPTPTIFKILRSNIKLNDVEEKVIPLNIGVGSKIGSVPFLVSSDSEKNHVSEKSEANTNTIIIPITQIDLEVEKYGIPLFVKIDVEGYESEVLKGMKKTLKDAQLKCMLVELNGSAATFNIDENEIHHQIIEQGFSPYEYNPVDRSLKKLDSHGTHNTLYIRDHDFVVQRVQTAKKIKILGKEY